MGIYVEGLVEEEKTERFRGTSILGMFLEAVLVQMSFEEDDSWRRGRTEEFTICVWTWSTSDYSR